MSNFTNTNTEDSIDIKENNEENKGDIAQGESMGYREQEGANLDLKGRQYEESKQGKQQFSFDADANKVLELVIHSLYKNKDVFLRELISNAADALAKLQQEALLDQDLLEDDLELSINLYYNMQEKTLTIVDNGIGMNYQELVKNLGTVAHSGTQKFLEALKDKKPDLIGQFGVGFYSAFIVADQVEVLTRRAGEKTGYLWASEGKDSFTIEACPDNARGTSITLHLKEEGEEFLNKFKIQNIVNDYSSHIPFPINLINESYNDNDDNSLKDGQPKTPEKERLNASAPIWAKPKNEVTAEEHQAFFREVAHVGGAPWMIFHNKNEGSIEYTNLLYIPPIKPFDLYNPERRVYVKLYVRKIFITADIEILPRYLRFMRGIIDCLDLPLNVSRETLQYNNIISVIRKSLTNKIINGLKERAENEPEKYISEFWPNFGAVLKEGLCEAMPTDEREKLMGICRFYSMKQKKLISLEEYIAAMPEAQKEIYYLGGNSIESIKNSPQLEGFASRGLDVLFFTDPVDDFWTSVISEYKDKTIKSVTRAEIDLEAFKLQSETSSESDQDANSKTEDNKDGNLNNSDNPNNSSVENKEAIDALIKYMEEALKDSVSKVRISKKLTGSPVCLVVPADAMDLRMERFMLEQKQLHSKSKKILEINIKHAVILKLTELLQAEKKEEVKELSQLLFDEACLIEGEEIANPMQFSKLMNKMILAHLQAISLQQ